MTWACSDWRVARPDELRSASSADSKTPWSTRPGKRGTQATASEFRRMLSPTRGGTLLQAGDAGPGIPTAAYEKPLLRLSPSLFVT